MDYVDKVLGENEIVLRYGRIAWPYHALSWLALILLGLLGVGIVIFIWMQIWLHTTEFSLTDRKLIAKRGFLSRTSHEVPLTSLDEVEVQQGFWGRILGFGRLNVWGSDRGVVLSPPIDDPVGYRSDLSDARARIIQPEGHQPNWIDDRIDDGVPVHQTNRERAVDIAEWD